MSAHKQPPMFDSDVIIDAIDGICGKKTDDARAGLELLRDHERFCISSVTAFELMHTDNARQRAVFDELPFEEHALVKGVTALAAEIANHARKSGQLCPKCWAMLPTRECKDCKSQVARQQRINDILIAATAEYNGVGMLYARDGGMLALGELKQFFKTTIILKPPPAPEQLEIADAIPISEQRRKKRARSK